MYFTLWEVLNGDERGRRMVGYSSTNPHLLITYHPTLVVQVWKLAGTMGLESMWREVFAAALMDEPKTPEDMERVCKEAFQNYISYKEQG